MYYYKLYENIYQFVFLKKIIRLLWVFTGLAGVGSLVFWGYSDFLINVFIKFEFCGNKSVGRTSNRMLHEEHKLFRIIFGHRVYCFDRRSEKSIKTLLVS